MNRNRFAKKNNSVVNLGMTGTSALSIATSRLDKTGKADVCNPFRRKTERDYVSQFRNSQTNIFGHNFGDNESRTIFFGLTSISKCFVPDRRAAGLRGTIRPGAIVLGNEGLPPQSSYHKFCRADH